MAPLVNMTGLVSMYNMIHVVTNIPGLDVYVIACLGPIRARTAVFVCVVSLLACTDNPPSK